MAQHQQPNYQEILVDVVASFTDNGRSLRSFIKLMMQPEDAIKASFDIHARIQKHVGNYQSMQFAASVNEAFIPQHPEVDPNQGETEWGD